MLRIHSFLISLAFILLCFSGVSAGQLWSGIITSPRAIDWSATNPGVVGGIPSATWTQCGPTIAAYTGTAAAINSAIKACGANQYVLLAAGTFTLSSGITFGNKSNVVLRGMGANSTFLVFPAAGTQVSCSDGPALICVNSSDGTYWTPGTGINWTAGYSQGATQVTLSSTSGISTNTILVLNQCDTGYSGVTCAGSAVDNGNFFNCSDAYSATGPTACAFNGPDNGNGTTHRFQTELFQVTNVNSSTGVVTLGTGLKHPNWASSQSPQAWYFTPIQNVGVESLSINSTGTGSSGAAYAIEIFNSLNTWVKGVEIIDAYTAGIAVMESLHFSVQDNYLYQAQSADAFGIHLTVTADGLVQNNIIQQNNTPFVIEGDDVGTVFAYNFTVNNCNNPSACQDNVNNSYRPHSNGTDYELYEGNVGTNYDADGDHGTHLAQTHFRNFFTGWESCGNGQCGTAAAKDFLTNAYLIYAFQGRYHNLIASVLGTPGYHTAYQYAGSATNNCGSNYAVIEFSIPVVCGGAAPPADTIVGSTFMRWGNYDVVTGAARWCGNSSDTGWSTTCASTSEVPSGISVYPNSEPTKGDTVAGQGALPASFYLTSKPSWFGSTPWPAIGPDVTGGNVGQCTGTLNTPGHYSGVPATSSAQCTGTSLGTAWGGHVNAIPAMSCYLNVMNGPPDGTGGVLSFNANSCYASAISAPANLAAVVN